jgi:hypothetical protein
MVIAENAFADPKHSLQFIEERAISGMSVRLALRMAYLGVPHPRCVRFAGPFGDGLVGCGGDWLDRRYCDLG